MPPWEESSGQLTTSVGGARRKPTTPPASSTFTGTPPAQLAALAACPSQASGGGNQNHASFSFSPNAIFQELGEAGSQSLSSFSQGVNDFHELILFRKEEDYIFYIYIYVCVYIYIYIYISQVARCGCLGIAEWMLQGKETKTWTHPPTHVSKFTIHLIISQIAMESLPSAQASLGVGWGGNAETKGD